MKKRFSSLSILGALIGAGIAVFSVLMLTKVLPYFSGSYEMGTLFLSTKPNRVLSTPVFLAAFYVHISSSLWVMALGIVQFIPTFVRSRPTWHRWAGKVYILSILLLSAPSGLVLALYANGGLPAKVGFSLQCLVWGLTTYAAWNEIRRKKWLPHIEWMLRSYAVTLAAMSLRTESYLMVYGFGTKPIETYLTVTWLSWTGNLVLAEGLIRWGLARWLMERITRKTTL